MHIKSPDSWRDAIGVGVAMTLLAACGGSQPLISARGEMARPMVIPLERGLTGTAFAISALGKERPLYRFRPWHNGGTNPQAGLVAVAGKLYGTTVWGGGSGKCKFINLGCGTVYSLTLSGKKRDIHSFAGGAYDGELPVAGLIGASGTLYGMTPAGGPDNCGTVFTIGSNGGENVIHSFNCQDGADPSASLIVHERTLYGTTYSGGVGWGNIFAMSTSGSELWQYNFTGYPADGEEPSSSLVALHGMLYGTTVYGGTNDTGTVFAVSPTGKERVLYSFQNFKSDDGFGPDGSLIVVNGALYGTTLNGGSGNRGTIFTVTTSGVERVIYRFKGGSDGAFPMAGLISVNGDLYGTTYSGGTSSPACG
ncbi:MAG: choice-of-anchor tandem repeat GloVer-containing protein [Candidatus Cybelea sp.]